MFDVDINLQLILFRLLQASQSKCGCEFSMAISKSSLFPYEYLKSFKLFDFCYTGDGFYDYNDLHPILIPGIT